MAARSGPGSRWGSGLVGSGLVVALAALLIAAAVSAWVLGGRTFSGLAPSYAPSAVPARGAGSSTVELSADAARHPAAAAIEAQSQRYFDAINARNYALWATTVGPERVAQQPQAQWTAGVRSTTDGTIRIDRIVDLDAARMLALVRFVSTQDVADAPAGLPAPRICWRAALPMSGSPLRVDTGYAGSLLGEAC